MLLSVCTEHYGYSLNGRVQRHLWLLILHSTLICHFILVSDMYDFTKVFYAVSKCWRPPVCWFLVLKSMKYLCSRTDVLVGKKHSCQRDHSLYCFLKLNYIKTCIHIIILPCTTLSWLHKFCSVSEIRQLWKEWLEAPYLFVLHCVTESTQYAACVCDCVLPKCYTMLVLQKPFNTTW